MANVSDSASVGPDYKKLAVGAAQDYALVLPGKLVMGNVRVANSEKQLSELGIGAVLNLIQFPRGKGPNPIGLPRLHCPVEDLPLSGIEWAEAAALFVDEHIAAGRTVYVHCSQGVSRATTFTLYYLMTREHLRLAAALDLVKQLRPIVCPSMGFMAGLVELDAKLSGSEPSLTVDGYILRCLHEVFPTLEIALITKAIERATEKLLLEAELTAFKAKVGDNIHPVGYLAMDLLMAEHPQALVKRQGTSLHHPFD